MTAKKNPDMITIHTKAGEVQVLPLARWKETVGTSEYEFALHVIPVEGVYNPPLGLTEVSTGASMQADMPHPNGSGPLRESHTKPGHRGYLPAAKIERLGYIALKKQINSVSAERFESTVGINLLARAQRDQILAKQASDKKAGKKPKPEAEVDVDGGAEEKPMDAVVEEKPLDQTDFACEICGDSGVVSTTETDHEGNPIEAACPHLQETKE